MKLKAASARLRKFRSPAGWAVAAIFASFAVTAYAQNCQISGDLDDASRTSITAASQRMFDLAAKGDIAALRQSAIPSLASDFAGIEASIKDHHDELAGAQGTVKSLFLLQTEGSAPTPHAEFYCGVFGKSGQTAGSAVFYLDNLPPGKYAVVVIEGTSAKGKVSFALVLEQSGTDWKLGNLFLKSSQVAGHDSDWFISQARQYKSKGQSHNAWLFYLQGRKMMSPVPFMSTATTDKLDGEFQGARPADLPGGGKTSDLAAGSVTYKLADVFPDPVGKDLDLIIKYEVADASNGNQAYASNVAVMKAYLAQYPELRDAFAAVVARAVDKGGHDYGTLLAMKDIK